MKRTKLTLEHLIPNIVTKHPDGRMVYITGGSYMGSHGVSNFFYRREVMEDGSLSNKEENGYGWAPTKSYQARVISIDY